VALPQPRAAGGVGGGGAGRHGGSQGGRRPMRKENTEERASRWEEDEGGKGRTFPLTRDGPSKIYVTKKLLL
jgi:hypothetical protein